MFIQCHERHLKGVQAALGLEHANASKTPCSDDSPPEVNPELSADRHATFRSCVMTLQYLTQDRADVVYACRRLTTKMQQPTEHDWKALTKLVRYLIGTASLGVFLADIDSNEFRPGTISLSTHVDSDWGKDKETRRSVAACSFQADGCQLGFIARQQTYAALSSAEAELGAILTGSTETHGYKVLFEWLGWKVRWEVCTDSAAARAIGLREGLGKQRHLDLKLLWVQHATKHLGLKLSKVAGDLNRADIGTKALPGPRVLAGRAMNHLVASEGLDTQERPTVYAIEEVDNGAGAATSANFEGAVRCLVRALALAHTA